MKNGCHEDHPENAFKIANNMAEPKIGKNGKILNDIFKIRKN